MKKAVAIFFLALLAASASEAQELGLRIEPEVNCSVKRGSWRKSVRTAMPRKVGYHRDHIVPWDEAIDSGLCSRSRKTQLNFYNDLRNLQWLRAKTNIRKGNKDYADYTQGGQCGYLRAYLNTKRRWNLSADPREAAALKRGLARCPNFS